MELAMINESAGTELIVRSDRQIKIENSDGTRLHRFGLLSVLDAFRDAGFEFLQGMTCSRQKGGLFFIAEAILMDEGVDLITAIDTVTSVLGKDCVYEDHSVRGCNIRLADEGEADALLNKYKTLRAQLERESIKNRKLEAKAWANG